MRIAFQFVVKVNVSKKVKYTEQSSLQPGSPLWELRYHMGLGSPAVWQRGDNRTFTPAGAGTQFSDPRWMQGRVDPVGWLHTGMVYLPEDGHPPQY